jgi:hypothetical protein
MSPTTDDKRYHWNRGHAYVLEGGKSLILINGGAAIGAMTFAGNSHISVSWALVVAVGLFAFGALSGTVLFLLSYLAELRYGNGEWTLGQRLHERAYVPAIFAAVLFVLGMIAAGCALRATTCAAAPVANSSPTNEVQHPPRAPARS